MGLGKTYSTKYLLDSNNSSGVAGQVLSTTSTGIDWVDANTVPGSGLWLENGNDIYNSNSGNVGIGMTTAPDEKLDVAGNIQVTGTSVTVVNASDPSVAVSSTDTNYKGIMTWRNSGSENVLEFVTRYGGTYYTNNLVLDRGNVGIGTTLPSATLDVHAPSTTAPSLTMGAAAGQIFKNEDSELAFGLMNASPYNVWMQSRFNGDVARPFLINPLGGNVGIGTTSPGYKLEVDGTTQSNIFRTPTGNIVIDAQDIYSNYDYTGNDGSIRLNRFGYQGGQTKFRDVTIFNGKGSQIMTIDGSTSNVGIGTTSPQERLDVNTNSTGLNVDNTAAIFGNDIGTTQSRDTWIKMRASASTNDRSWAFGTNQSGDFRFNYLGDRTITPTNAAASTLLTIKNTGNVGIGTDDPLGKLMVRDDTAGAPTRLIVSNGGTAQAGTTARLSFYEGTSEKGYIERRRDGSGKIAFVTPADDNPFVWENPTGEIMRINNSKVGIGVTAPQAPLHVVTTGDLSDALILEFAGTYQGGPYQTFQYNEGGSSPSENGDLIGGIRARTAYDTSSGYAGYSTAVEFRNDGNPTSTSAPGRIEFKTTAVDAVAPVERMRINNAGAIQFNAYDGTNNTGSPTHILGTDASGNVVKSTAGSSIGPWLPLAAGSGDPLTGTLYGTDVIMSSGMILGNAIQNATVNLQIGEGRTGNGFSFIDLIGDATYTDYGFRMLRGNTGPNALSILEHRGTGAFEIKAAEAADIVFETTATERMRITSSGNIGIGGDTSAWSLGKTIQINGDYGAINYNGVSAILGIVNAYYNGSGYIRQNVGYAASIDFNTAVSGGGLAFRTENSTGAAGDTISLTTKVAILSNGTVGIGTTTVGTVHGVSYGPTMLHVDGGSSRGQMILEGDQLAGVIMSDNGATANERVFTTMVDGGNYQIKPVNDNGTSTAGGAAITVLHGGNVGIGITTPQTTLQVNGTENQFNAHFGQGANNTDGYFGGISLGYAENGNASYRKVGIVSKALGDGAARADLCFLVDIANDGNSAGLADTKMMIDGITGYVGIGVTGPDAKLHVLGNVILDGYSTSDPDSTSRTAYPAAQMFTHATEANGVSIIGGQGGYTGCGLTIGEETGRSSDFKFIRGISDTNGGAAEEFYVNGVGTAYFAGTVTATNFNSSGAVISGTVTVTKAQETNQFDTSSFLRLHPSAVTNSSGYTNMFFGTSTANNFGVAIGAVRAGTGDTSSTNDPAFTVRILNDSVIGTEVLRINTAGNATFDSNVGVAGKTPTHGLTLAQGTAVGNKIVWSDITPNFAASIYASNLTDKLTFATKNASNAETTALEIDTSQNAIFSGNVGVNMTTTPAATLHVTGTIFATAKFGNLVTGTSGVQFEAPDTAMQTCRFDSDALRFYAGGSSSPSTRFTITESGTSTFVDTVTATNFILSSDETLKDNIKEIDNKHIDVNWKNFELKSEPGVKRSGVIAQELEKKHPEFVRTDDEGLKSVAYIDLLISKIAELEARLEKAGI